MARQRPVDRRFLQDGCQELAPKRFIPYAASESPTTWVSLFCPSSPEPLNLLGLMDGKYRTTVSIGCIQTKDSYNVPQSSSQNRLHLLGSKCSCWVQGIRVEFKASTLGWRRPCWVRDIRVGFETSVLGSKCPCWV